jgi:hypothetical protein
MAAALLPLAAAALPGILTGVSGLLGIINEGRKLHGGRLRRLRRHKLKTVHKGGKLKITRVHKYPIGHHGRGPIADAIGSIPLLGMVAGPLIRAFGGRLRKRRGRGFSPMYMHREFGRGFGYGMLTPPGGQMLPYAKQLSSALMPFVAHAPKRLGMGLLAPAGGRVHRKKRGGKLVHRKGYYRYIHGKRVHVAPTTVHIGGRVHKKKTHAKRRVGGYVPYRWRLP